MNERGTLDYKFSALKKSEDGETLEVDYQAGIVRAPASGASVALRKFPSVIEQIFAAGGLPESAYARYMRECAGQTK